MYWIYLIIFTATVFVPSFIDHGVFSLSIIQTQEYTILLIGLLAYFIFLFQEKSLRSTETKRSEIQKEANRMTRDLTQSYSYIGEINRKLDIMKSLMRQYPANEMAQKKHEQEFFFEIIEAIKAITKSQGVVIRIADSSGMILQEIKQNKDLVVTVSSKDYCDRNKSVCETDSHIMVCSPLNSAKIHACIIICKPSGNMQKIQDPDFLKALASHALFLYSFSHKKH